MRSQNDRGPYPEAPDRRRWTRLVARLRGVAAGVGAFLAGYGCYRLVARLSYPGGTSDAVAAADPGAWRFGAWLFFAAHDVPVVLFRENTLSFSTRPTRIPLGAPSLLGSEVLGYLVPVLALLAAGVAVDRLSRPNSGWRAALDGSTVTLGYAFPVAFLALAARLPRPPASTIAEGDVYFFGGPLLPVAILVAGLVYPAVFGGLGGAASYLTRATAARREGGGRVGDDRTGGDRGGGN